jgi:hypothetical protein
MRRIGIFLAPFLVAGCALPPAVMVASLAADGVSYAATGKSTTDHAISAIAEEDCALLRVVKEESVCKPDGTNGTSNPNGTNNQVLVSQVEAEPLGEDLSDPDDSLGVFRPHDD